MRNWAIGKNLSRSQEHRMARKPLGTGMALSIVSSTSSMASWTHCIGKQAGSDELRSFLRIPCLTLLDSSGFFQYFSRCFCPMHVVRLRGCRERTRWLAILIPLRPWRAIRKRANLTLMLPARLVLFPSRSLSSSSSFFSSSLPSSSSLLCSLRNIDVLLVFICSHRPPSRCPCCSSLRLHFFLFSSHLSDILRSATYEYRHRQQANFLLSPFLSLFPFEKWSPSSAAASSLSPFLFSFLIHGGRNTVKIRVMCLSSAIFVFVARERVCLYTYVYMYSLQDDT